MAKARRATKKTVKKVWVQILAPPMFNKQVIGETLVAEPNLAMDKIVPANLMTLTRDMRNQNNTVKFKVNKVEGQKAFTEFIGYSMNLASLKKMVRRGKNKISQSLVFKTADDKIIRIKSIIITRNLVQNSVDSSLRKINKEILAREISKMKFDQLGQEVTSHKMQSMMKKALDKTYPLRMYEFNALKIDNSKTSLKQLISPTPED